MMDYLYFRIAKFKYRTIWFDYEVIKSRMIDRSTLRTCRVHGIGMAVR